MIKKPDGKQAEILFSWCGAGHAPIKLAPGGSCPICEAYRRVAEFNKRPRREFNFEETIDELKAECFFCMDGYKKEIVG